MTGTLTSFGTLQFTTDNKYAYAFSGPISVIHTGAAQGTLIEGSTQSEYLIAEFTLGSEETTDNMSWLITLDDITVIRVVSREPYDFNLSGYEIIIPPFTNFKVIGFNGGGVAARTMFGTMAAKVGGAIEQENLESITNNNKWASK